MVQLMKIMKQPNIIAYSLGLRDVGKILYRKEIKVKEILKNINSVLLVV